MSTQNKARNKNAYASIVLFVTDLFSICLSFGLAILIRNVINPLFEKSIEPFSNYWALILINVLIMILIFALMGLYRGYGLVAVIELRNLTQSIFIAFIIFSFSTYLFGQGGRLSRAVLILSLFFCLILIPLLRLIIYHRFSRSKNWGVKVAVIASRQEFPNITDRLLAVTRLGFIPVGIFCTDYKQNEASLYKGIPVGGFSYEECKKLRDGGIDFAFYASANLSYEDEVLTVISRIFPAVYYVLPESDLSSLWVETTDMLGRPVLKVSYHLFEKVQNSLKRIIEVAMALLALIITLPLSLLLMLLLALEKKGPVFYEQRRLGLNGKQFQLIKFRTMVSDADSVFEQHLNENPEARQEYEQFHKLKNDPRITRIGSFIRKYSLDEIPQLINVVSGDMNLIGPRAYMVNEVDLQEEDYRTILKVRPGVTGWWQVMGRNNTTFVERKNLDLYYIKNWSLWLDYYILIKTGWIILSGQGK